jgi:hypothetical protein
MTTDRDWEGGADPKVTIGYRGNRLPWGLLLIWLALFAWAGWYVLHNVVPSLQEWLGRR